MPRGDTGRQRCTIYIRKSAAAPPSVGRDVPSCASEAASDSPGRNDCARARVVEELAIGRARTLQKLAKCDGNSRRYIRRLVGVAFLIPQLFEAILQGRQSVELTAARPTELDVPLGWTKQHKLRAS
jgi:hypothetical protein